MIKALPGSSVAGFKNRCKQLINYQYHRHQNIFSEAGPFNDISPGVIHKP